MSYIVSICARSGSKGVPNKNISDLFGLPLIKHAILQAQEVFSREEIWVSTDSEQYCSLVKDTGVNCIIRENNLADDVASKIDVIRDLYIKSNSNSKYVIDIDVSAPIRFKKDILIEAFNNPKII